MNSNRQFASPGARRRCGIFLVWILCLGASPRPGAAGPAPGQDTKAGRTASLTLGEAIRLAFEHNPEWRGAAAAAEAAAGRADQARLWPNPELELSGEEVPLDGGGFSRGIVQAGVAQALPFPGKKRWDTTIGTAEVAASRAERERLRADLVRRVKSAYYRAQSTARLVEVATQLVSVAESSGQAARRRVELGETALQEQLRVEIQVEETRSELSERRRERDDAHAALLTVLGRPDLGGVILPDEPVSSPAGAAPMGIDPPPSLLAHPEMTRARAERDLAEAALRRAQLDAYPDVRVGIAGGRDGDSGGSIVSLSFSLPLPLIDRARGRVAEARANLVGAEAALESVALRLAFAWREASHRVRAAAEQVAAYRDRVLPRSNEALRLVQTGFQDGKFELIDLLDTQRTAAEARVTYERKLLELRLADAELEALAGPGQGWRTARAGNGDNEAQGRKN